MSSALAIISKAVFEKQAPGAAPGTVLALDHYASTHASLAGLADGGALYLVTARPDDVLWLVAVLEQPKLGKTGWTAKANAAPIADITRLIGKLKFASGTGITAKKGQLGMSLQTPRALTDTDVALLRGAMGKPGKGAKITAPIAVAKPAKKTKSPKAESAAKPAAPAVPSGDHLAALQDAFAENDGAAALTAALTWWRVQRAPALADLIDAISQRISGAPVASEIEFAKVAAAKNPLDLGRLLPAVPDLQVNFLPTVSELLAAYPDDPRIAAAFATWVPEPITTSISKTGFWTKMHATVEKIGDTRIIPTLQKRLRMKKWSTDWWDRYYNRIRRTVDRLAAAPAVAIDAKPLAKLRPDKLKLAAKPAVVTAAAAAPKLTGPLLAQAATHLAAGRTVAAIDAMVTRWRETRVPLLADLVDRGTLLLPTHDRPLITHGGYKEEGAAWHAAFEADPALHLPQLLASIGAGSARASEVHISMIAGLPDDPRIAIGLAQRCNVTGRREGQFDKVLFQTLERHRDIRTFAPVRAIYDDFDSTYFYAARPAKRYMGKLCMTPEKFFDPYPPVLDAADGKLADKLAAQLDTAVTKATQRERDLVAAIAADWKSDGPREVYADYLTEREHPRGEMILLEMKKKPSAEEAARRDELDKLCVYGALGAFVDDEDKPRERGLYRDIKLRYDAHTLHWRAAAAHPLVALVETMEIDGELPTPADFATFVAAATSLRTIKGIGREGIELLDPDNAKRWKVAGSGQNVSVSRR